MSYLELVCLQGKVGFPPVGGPGLVCIIIAPRVSVKQTGGGGGVLQFFTLQNGLLYNLFLGVLLVAKCAGAVAGQYPGRNLAQGYTNIVGVRYGSYSVTMLHQGGGFQILNTKY